MAPARLFGEVATRLTTFLALQMCSGWVCVCVWVGVGVAQGLFLLVGCARAAVVCDQSAFANLTRMHMHSTRGCAHTHTLVRIYSQFTWQLSFEYALRPHPPTSN